MPAFDLTVTLRDLATRNPGRTEADIQASIRDVLLYGGFDLGDEAVVLESPAEDRKRLDVAVGALIIECKKDLRPLGVLTRAELQLGGYLAGKSASGGNYAGILTDGVIWRLYRYTGSGLEHVDSLLLSPARMDDRRFRWWLGGVLATEHRVLPTADVIRARLGAGTPGFSLARAALMQSWERSAEEPGISVKRQLWVKLLQSALGTQFEATDELFVEHTYLVLLATLIAHAVAGFNLDAYRNSPAVLLSGQLFEQAGILGVGQAGFFDWVLDTEQGPDIVSDVARRVASFEWADVDHDVLKALYHSVISPQVRKRLGEYYTPDWLANRMVENVVTDPLNQRVLDPACGSGTFIFHAVRHYLHAADSDGIPLADAIADVTGQVFGVDLHPVAVTLAQTTYLLAIGPERLAQRSRTISIPVYLGDSMRWEAAEEDMYTPSGDIVLYTPVESGLFGRQLHFPASLVADVSRFDYFVNVLVERATSRAPNGPKVKIDGLLRTLTLTDEEQSKVKETYDVLCDLHDERKDHIWSFYIRNQSRPTWLSRPENRVDVLVGNPPWLYYRYMPGPLQEVYERRARERGLWLGGARGRTTQQDLAPFFVARAIELYLREGSHFGFVMPRATLTRQTYGGFRKGNYSSDTLTNMVAFTTPWDLEDVDPDPFPVPSCVVFGAVAASPRALPVEVLRWSGRAPTHGTEGGTLTSADATVIPVTGEEAGSWYKEQFRQGAILAPRMLMMIVDAPVNPLLGVPKGRRSVRSRKKTLDKKPWKDLKPIEGVVDSIFIRPVYLGESVAPFRVLATFEAIIPYDGKTLMDGGHDKIDQYEGLANWWRKAEQVWEEYRSSERRTLNEQLDYMRQLSSQFPIGQWRVAYTASGNTLAAAVIEDHLGIIEHKLYWARAQTRDEANYLAAVLNAPALNKLVRPYQSVGAFGARDFDKYVWLAPIPRYDPSNFAHRRLRDLAVEGAALADGVDVEGLGFQSARKAIRRKLNESGVAASLDETIIQILGR
ncbi:MAG TPA: N-6 DNA methylase [Gammaproteobacteria bacterium]|nr:N-6 DNA methylase [Gammaproteobacteria bacterium]